VTDAPPWFETAFAAGYLEVYPHRDLPAARREVAGLVERGLRGRVLDLGCGFGRHSLALLEAGLEVVGLDLSMDLLRASGRLPGSAALAGRLVRGDFRALPFAGGTFDGVAMLFSSFGYFDDATNGRVLAGLARVLRPGGTALLDLMNPRRVRSTLVPASRTERDGLVLEERRRLSAGGRRVRKDVELELASGERRIWHEDVRLYETDELRALAERAGLVLGRVEGDFDGRAFDAGAPRQILWLTRGPGTP